MSRRDIDRSLVGRVLAGYRIESVLGRGAMGTVYLAHDARLQRQVALKVLAPELGREDAFRQRFLRETRIAIGLDHPNVVPVYDAGDVDGVLFLAMRYVEGSDLRALLRRAGPLEARRATTIVAQVARALDAAHARGLVHRDVKPGNVLIAEDEHAYLADFGVSQELDAPALPGAYPAAPMGTVAYLAPEQIEGGPVDGRADQYGLACVLYECVCGAPPFTYAGSDMAVLWAHLEDEPRPVSDVRPGQPAALDAVLARALAKDPRQRFATCQAMTEAALSVLAEVELATLPAPLAALKSPLIGREAEIAWLLDAWSRAQRGEGALVLVTGPRGSGKTRLAAELACTAQADGAQIRYASGLGAQAPALRVLTETLSARGPALAVLDDLDAAREELLEALHSTTAAVDRRSVLVIGTMRDLTSAPLRSLESTTGHRRLGPLARPAIRELAGLYAGAYTDDVPVDRIADATGGLPGPVHELAAEWARAEAGRRLHASADRAADERSSLRDAEAHLAQDVVEIQLVRERARLYVPEADASTRPLATCPFMGLASFDRADADVFFGREQLVAQLVAALAGSTFLAIVGPSGSGKSSILRAGLLPALAGGVLPGSERWQQVVIRPADEPAIPLVQPQDPKTDQPRRLIAIDQFEELFTAEMTAEARSEFAASVAAAQSQPGTVVILALRADFYGRCSAYPDLAELLAAHHVLVGAMQPDELRRAIELPASRAGLQVEAELADALVRDVTGEPGALPLLSTALLELCRQRRGTTLSLDAYRSSGGVRGAVARMAEAAYADLDDGLRATCRALLLRMVTDEPGIGLVRRRVPLSELELERHEDTRTVFSALTARRLVTVGQHGAEVAHEALLAEWPRLRDWLRADAEGRAVRQHLSGAAAEWRRSSHPARDAHGAADLYRGPRLAAALDWRVEHEQDLTDSERAFLDASRAAEQSELEAAQRRTRRLRALALTLAVLVLVAGVSTVLAVRQSQRAESERRSAVSRSLVSQALSKREDDPDLAALLSLEAYRIERTVDARSALLTMLPSLEYRTGSLRGHTDFVSQVVYDRDGKMLVSASGDGTVRLWDVAARRALGPPLTGHSGGVRALALSGDGTTLATAGDDETVRLWDVAARRPLGRALRAGFVEALAFSGDGKTLASVAQEGTVRRWDVAAQRPLGRALHVGFVDAVAFSPDGGTLATAGAPGKVRLWDVPSRRPLGRPLTGDAHLVSALTFSADGKTLASAGDSGTVLWDVAKRRALGRPLPAGQVDALAFSADGKLASTGIDGTVQLWDVTGRAPLGRPLAGHAGRVLGLSFSPDGKTLAAAGDDGDVRLWDVSAPPAPTEPFANDDSARSAEALSADARTFATGAEDGTVQLWDAATRRALGPPLTNRAGFVSALAFGADGGVLASGADDGTLRLWDVAARRVLTPPPNPHAGFISALAFTPDAKTLAFANEDGTIRLWDLATQRTLGEPLGVGHTGWVAALAFNRDGHTLASGAKDGTVRLWDVAARRVLGPPLGGHTGQVLGVAFSPDGSTLASAGSGDGTVQLWDVATRRSLGPPLTGNNQGLAALAFSRDSKTLAAAGQDGTVRLWDVAERRALGQSLTGGHRSVAALAFSPDGTKLASVGGGTARLWDSILWSDDSHALRTRVCEAVRRSLTHAEWTEAAPGERYHGTCRPG